MKTITTLISFIFMVNFSVAQPGTLDSSFGTDGKIINYNFAKAIYSTKVQQDGKIVIGGLSLSETVIIARFNSNGTIDSSFNGNGIVTTNLFPSTGLYSTIVKNIALQPDGKIVASGNGFRDVGLYGDYDVFLLRYNVNGSLDESFGNNGIVISDFNDTKDLLGAMTLQPDGKIVIGGRSSYAFVARYNADGSLDTTFNNVGWVKFGSGYFGDVKVQDDLKIVLGGDNTDKSTSRFLLMRLFPDGKRDSSFGTNGTVITDFATGGGNEAVNSLAIQDDGKIIAAGGTADESGDIAIARYKTNGTLDTSFGDAGKVTTTIEGRHSYSNKILLSAGKIIVAGWAKDFMIARYNKDGSLNDNFGDSGITITDFGLSNGISDADVQSDGKIVGAGFRGGYTALLARYNNEEPITISFKKNEKVVEGNTGITKASFKIILSQPSSKDISVSIATKDGTATAESDYKAKSGTVTIKAGRTSKNIEVNIIGDSIQENNEKFSLVLSNPVNAILGEHASAECTIRNDDILFALNTSSKENIESENSASVKIYPNPVKNILHVTRLSATQKTTLSITDLSGAVRAVVTVTGSSYNWNIGQLKAGSYILRIENGDLVVSKMFIKE